MLGTSRRRQTLEINSRFGYRRRAMSTSDHEVVAAEATTERSPRGVPTLLWHVPRMVKLSKDGHYLRYGPVPRLQVEATRTMLSEFTSIAGGSDVLRFARRFGPLGICVHGRPASHDTRTGLTAEHIPCTLHGWTDAGDQDPDHPTETGDPVQVWLKYVSEASAMLTIAHRLKDSEPGDAADWTTLQRPGMQDRHLDDQTEHLARHTQGWLNDGDVRPRVDWIFPAPPTVELVPSLSPFPLFGVLALLITYGLSGGSPGAVNCSRCGAVYLPSRKPRGERHYCYDCKAFGPQADWARRNRPSASTGMTE